MRIPRFALLVAILANCWIRVREGCVHLLVTKWRPKFWPHLKRLSTFWPKLQPSLGLKNIWFQPYFEFNCNHNPDLNRCFIYPPPGRVGCTQGQSGLASARLEFSKDAGWFSGGWVDPPPLVAHGFKEEKSGCVILDQGKSTALPSTRERVTPVLNELWPQPWSNPHIKHPSTHHQCQNNPQPEFGNQGAGPLHVAGPACMTQGGHKYEAAKLQNFNKIKRVYFIKKKSLIRLSSLFLFIYFYFKLTGAKSAQMVLGDINFGCNLKARARKIIN